MPQHLPSLPNASAINRRTLLRLGSGGVLVLGTRSLLGCSNDLPGTMGAPTAEPPGRDATSQGVSGRIDYALGDADSNGVRLPDGFRSRVVATSGREVAGTGFVWPADPDGAACFVGPDGTWRLVQNQESNGPDGGVSFIEFSAGGEIQAAGRLLDGTHRNCAGGATPWGTWLSCEEHTLGAVYEVWPDESREPQRHDGLGLFAHEAAAVDPQTSAVYLTEDEHDGGLYRFTPTVPGELTNGRLEVATGVGQKVQWVQIPDALAAATPTRHQITDARPFAGGEGICHVDGQLYFTTKYDNRVWALDPATDALSVVYDGPSLESPVLSGVDNIAANGTGQLMIAEDGDDMQVVMLLGTVDGGSAVPILQITGVEGSEVTGLCFDPSGERFYCASQRNPGTVFEISGPWPMPR